ncbi:ABC transporter permease [Lactobacillus sp. CC-MHH1034]|uniref:ABC transporter permease n=1 Tax=Agrilactobacillus fermenti TaxID=2586909 RepID=UPI001E598D51|nr:ABC transporter permease [Agrilactobacillus fermenti]MCD2257441.1 ABC transporter permease [Agrilactobacillus fermenti]
MAFFQSIFYNVLLQFKMSLSRPMYRFTLIVSPIVNTMLIFEMFRKSNVSDAANYIVFGSGLMGLWSSITFSSIGDISRERYIGTLSTVYVAPLNFNLTIFYRIIGNTILSSMAFLISIISAHLFFKISMPIYHKYYFIISFIMIIVSFSIISMPISYLMLISRKSSLYMNMIEYPIFILCGFAFPTNKLPALIRFISYVLTPTWTTKLLHESLHKNLDIYQINHAFKETILLNLIYCLFILILWKHIDSQVRKNATLEVV